MSNIERQLRRKQIKKMDEMLKENRRIKMVEYETRLKKAEDALKGLIQYLRTRRLHVQQNQTDTIIGETRTETGLILPQ